jgi:hypothetical protein
LSSCKKKGVIIKQNEELDLNGRNSVHGNLQANLCRQICEYIGLRKEDQ